MHSRSREGAWIEILPNRKHNFERRCRSREGAWIEMLCTARILTST